MDENFMMFPKPPVKAKKKPLRNLPPKVSDRCIICNSIYASNHEPYGGKNRQKSIQYGLQVRLCVKDHAEAQRNGKLGQALKDQMKAKFLEDHTESEWLREFEGVGL